MLGDPSCLGKDSLIHNTRHIPSRRRHLWISQLSSQHQASHVKVATTWKVEFPWPFGFVALKKKLKIHRTLQPNNSDVIFPKKKMAVSQRGSYMNKGTNKRTQKNRWRFRAWNLMIRAVSCWDLPPPRHPTFQVMPLLQRNGLKNLEAQLGECLWHRVLGCWVGWVLGGKKWDFLDRCVSPLNICLGPQKLPFYATSRSW